MRIRPIKTQPSHKNSTRQFCEFINKNDVFSRIEICYENEYEENRISLIVFASIYLVDVFASLLRRKNIKIQSAVLR